MGLTIKTSDIRKAINEVISSQKAQKLIKEAMYRNMPGEGEDFPPFNGRRPKTVKARINQIYSLVNKYGLSSRKYTDDHWQATDDYDRILTHLGYEVHWDVKNGGYGDYRDGMPMSKTYDITLVAEDGMEIGGYIKCMAAGSNEDPFDAYDTCMVLWNKPKRRYDESLIRNIVESSIRRIMNENIGHNIKAFEGDEDLIDVAYDAAKAWADENYKWLICPKKCGDDQWTEGEENMAVNVPVGDDMTLTIDANFSIDATYYETMDDFGSNEAKVHGISLCLDGKNGYCYFELEKDDPLFGELYDAIEFSTENLEDYDYYSEYDQNSDEREMAELDNAEEIRKGYWP